MRLFRQSDATTTEECTVIASEFVPEFVQREEVCTLSERVGLEEGFLLIKLSLKHHSLVLWFALGW